MPRQSRRTNALFSLRTLRDEGKVWLFTLRIRKQSPQYAVFKTDSYSILRVRTWRAAGRAARRDGTIKICRAAAISRSSAFLVYFFHVIIGRENWPRAGLVRSLGGMQRITVTARARRPIR